MTTFTLSQATQNLIATALADGPGTNNSNYIAAYNAISADITAQGANSVNAGTAYWFSQAGAVNGQASTPTPAGTYIWAYTEGAAATQGYSVTNSDMQAASNKIAETVFNQLEDNHFVFSDESDTLTNFAPQSIVKNDAGSGIGYLPVSVKAVAARIS